MKMASASNTRILFVPDVDDILEVTLSSSWFLNEFNPLPKELIEELNSYLLFI